MKTKDIISNICYVITSICGLVVIYFGIIAKGDPILKLVTIIGGLSLIVLVIISIYTIKKLNKYLKNIK